MFVPDKPFQANVIKHWLFGPIGKSQKMKCENSSRALYYYKTLRNCSVQKIVGIT